MVFVSLNPLLTGFVNQCVLLLSEMNAQGMAGVQGSAENESNVKANLSECGPMYFIFFLSARVSWTCQLS